MKRKSIFIFSVAWVLTLGIGCMKYFGSTEVSAKEQSISGSVFLGQADIEGGDQYRVVTKEEQDSRENNHIENGNQYTVITVAEQNMVENSKNGGSNGLRTCQY